MMFVALPQDASRNSWNATKPHRAINACKLV